MLLWAAEKPELAYLYARDRRRKTGLGVKGRSAWT